MQKFYNHKVRNAIILTKAQLQETINETYSELDKARDAASFFNLEEILRKLYEVRRLLGEIEV